MSRVFASGLLLLRRTYTVAAENLKPQPAPAALRKVVDRSEVAKGVEKEVFWMKDPKTGNWIPESHFQEVDAADLRAKFISKKA